MSMAMASLCEKCDTPDDWLDNLREQRDELEALLSIYQDTDRVKVLCEVEEAEEVQGAEADTADIPKGDVYVLSLTVPVHSVRESVTVESWIPHAEAGRDAEAGQDAEAGAAAATYDAGGASPPTDRGGGGVTKPQYHRTASGHHWFTSFEVQYLVPFTLQVTLPMTYPSAQAPHFSLGCLWLDANQISSLCRQLDLLWDTSSGMPILFTWMDWLEQESLSYLGIKETVRLRVDDTLLVDDCHDNRAVAECTDPREDMIFMLQHDLREEHEEFRRTPHDCEICFEEKIGREFFRISECRHHFCQDCMASFCDMHVQDGTVTSLKHFVMLCKRCPAIKCQSTLPVPILASVLGPEKYQRWEKLQLDRALESLGDITYCPRCSFPVVCEEMNLAQCTQCHFSFCTRCFDSWHQSACASLEDKMAELETKSRDTRKTNKESARKMQLLKMEYLSINMIKKVSKPCPKCKQDIEKDGGCNKVTCTRCGQHMCWLCGQAIIDYDHFNKTKCVLFDMLNRIYERNLIPQPVPEGAVRVRNFLRGNPQRANTLINCPRCRQRNLKDGRNNHIRCWSCKSNFCFLCKKNFHNLTDHFSARGCPQHSD